MLSRFAQRGSRAVPQTVARFTSRAAATARASNDTGSFAQKTATSVQRKVGAQGVMQMLSPRLGMSSQVHGRWFSEGKKDDAGPDLARDTSAEVNIDAEAKKPEAPPEPPKSTVKGGEHSVGSAQAHEFKAETRQLLDIVAHSLYQDKEVFVRELVSNCSDALEKWRHTSLTSAGGEDASDLKVTITIDEKEGLLGFQDNGIGMSSEELVDNLGTIARSGSKAFLKQMSEGEASKGDVASNIIGRFGVGFYSSFMVADTVTVYSRKRGESIGHCWESKGDGAYTLSQAEALADGGEAGVEFGTKIVLTLREDSKDYAKESRIKEIVGKYSSFVSFPVELNGVKVNDVKALWQKAEAEIDAEEHTNLYRHISGEYEGPMFNLVYKADAPIDIKSVFYVPQMNLVLIQSNAKDLLPEYFRWIKGVVDSEDLPLSISRENMQDMKLLAKLKTVLTRRIIRWLQDEAKKSEEEYLKFYEQYGLNLKEGVAMDQQNGPSLAKLLRYPSSAAEDSKQVSLEAYVSRMKEGQNIIYYLVASSRKVAEGSPYYEAFKREGIEVLFCYNDHDEIVLGNLGKFMDKPLKSIEVAEPPAPADAKKEEEKTEEEKKKEEEEKQKEAEGGKALLAWMKESLSTRVSEVEATNRLVDSPAIISEHDNVVTRRMMQMAEFKSLGVTKPNQYKLQVNLKHPILVALNEAKESDPEASKLVAEQLLDNAIISAGILDDVRDMLPRLGELMTKALRK